jgi:hypothetical protein
VFAAQAGWGASSSGAGMLRADVIDGVQAVFLVAAPLAALALIVVLYLPELPLKTRAEAGDSSRENGRGSGGERVKQLRLVPNRAR